MKTKKIFLSETDKKVCGVFGGLGKAFNIDPTILRLLWIFIALVTGFFAAILVYILAWAVIPPERTHPVQDDAWTNE